ncbi:MAG TPA: hypothetical protein PK263_01325 [bacterium]|nr:hypothetical protein [bacterium]
MKRDLDSVDKKITILIKSTLLIILLIILMAILSFAGYWGCSKVKTTWEQNAAKKQTEEAAVRQESINTGLSQVKHIGDTANLGNLQLTLLEKKLVATLPSNNQTGLLEKKARNVVGLRFSIKNVSDKDQTFSRQMGWLATEDNPAQAVNVYPFAAEEYIKQTGDNYTFDTRDLLIKPNDEKESWIVLEVDTALAKPVFLYPPTEPNSKWAIGN